MNPPTSKDQHIAVMFADVAGSTSLYERLGDAEAKTKIDQCLSSMTQCVADKQGKLVQTIGDEIMCRFYDADHAAEAAVSIQNHIAECSLNDLSQLQVRIGIHFGLAIIEQDDIFGDVVNVAARMTGIAKAGQIIVTQQFAANLSLSSAFETRIFDRVKVKGKQQELSIVEIIWEQSERTIMQSSHFKVPDTPQRLVLCYQDIETTLNNLKEGFLMGRETGIDLTVNLTFASRHHAVIEHHRGKFVLIDQSTNGTFVKEQNSAEIYLRREELPLTGRGVISLGTAISNNTDHLIHYQC